MNDVSPTDTEVIMRSARLVTLLVAPLAALALVVTPAAAGGQQFTAVLSGANEVPPADPDGSGMAIVTINRGKSEVCWTVTVENLDPVVAAHIHVAPAGVNGPVVVPITVGTGCATVDRELAKAIAKDPAAYYVNVHTTVYPGGAIRGQLG
jgi:hypothetical protein